MRTPIVPSVAVGVFLLTGCSVPHPLQDDVTRLPLADIVRKITCEAQTALDELLTARGLSGSRSALKLAHQKIKQVNKKELEPLQEETKALQFRKKDLDLKITANDAGFNAVTAALTASPPGDKVPALQEKLRQLRIERAQILEELTEYMTDVKDHNERVAAAKKAVARVTKSSNKVAPDLAKYYGHQMAYSFRFRIIETNVVNLSPAWKLPVFAVNPSSWSIGGSIGDTKARESERNVKLVLNLEDLHGLDCTSAPTNNRGIRSLYYPITGKIGVKEVMAQYFRLLDRADEDRKREFQAKSIFAKTDAYTDSILFTTTIGASTSPSITLNPTLREQFTGNATLSANRVDYHSVLVSLSATDSEAADKSPAVQRMILVSDDGIE